MRFLVLLALLAACDRGKSPGKMDETRAAAMFTRVPVQADAGLSGLAIDGIGRLWTIAERSHIAYRFTMANEALGRVERFPVEGVPPETDLEAVAWLGGDRFALGTETHDHGRATVLLARERTGRLVVDGSIELPSSLVGVEVGNNHGAEGLCGAGNILFAAIETCGEVDGRRFAPIVRIDLTTGARTAYRVWMTTQTGKLSALDCSLDADGTARLVAVERHFDVTHVLELRIPANGPREIAPDRMTDLSPVLRGSLNLEGIVRRPDGRWIAVNDNQSGAARVAESQLLFFK